MKLPKKLPKPRIVIGDHPIQISRAGVTVGCTFVPRSTVEAILRAIKHASKTYSTLMRKFQIGDSVKVVADIGDSTKALGQVGTIINMGDSEYPPILVRFPKWSEGHGVGQHEWYLHSQALKKVRRAD